MRSRYTAFVFRDADYLLETWASETRPDSITFDPAQRWLGLRIKRTALGSARDAEGIVEFVARYKIHGRGYRLHETSQFRKSEDRWLYTGGEVK